MTWNKEIERQKAARKRLGLRGKYPYPVRWTNYITNESVMAVSPTEALAKFMANGKPLLIPV